MLAALAGLSLLGGPDQATGDAGAPLTDSSTTITPTTTTLPPLAAGTPRVTSTTTTTTTLPPTLADRVPDLPTDATLAVVTRGENGGSLLLWTPSERTPRELPLSGRPDIAAFDVSGAWLAYLELNRDSSALHLGLRSDAQPPQFLDVTSFVWHPVEPRTLAWIARVPLGDRYALYRGVVDETSGRIRQVVEVAEVAAGDRLTAWGPWGFAVNHAPIAGPTTIPVREVRDVPVRLVTIYDAGGVPQVSAAARVIGATADGTLLLDPAPRYTTLLDASGIQPASAGMRGTPVLNLPDHPVLTDAGLDELPTPTAVAEGDAWALLPDGTRVAVVRVAQTGRLSITTVNVSGRGTRIVSVEGPVIQFLITRQAEYVVVQRVTLADEGAVPGPLVLSNWLTGASFELPLPGEELVVAVTLD